MVQIKQLPDLLSQFLRKTPVKEREKGAITVAETLIALGVGATVLAVVFAGIPALVAARNASTGMNGLTQIVSSVRMTFGVRNNFGGLNTTLARNLAGFPQHFLIQGASSPQHPWSGNVEISGSGQTFSVEFQDMPNSACTSLVATTAEMAESIDIGGTVLDLNATDDLNTSGTDESVAADIAGLCANSPPNNVVWTFRG